MELNGKIAMVTGGGVRVGRAIAMALGRAGADVVLHYGQSEEQTNETAGEIRAMGRRVEICQADLGEPDEIAGMFEKIGRTLGRLDVLVNNAAIFGRTPIETLTAEQWDRFQAINARAPALCIRHAIPLMSNGGAIINITDIAAGKPWGNHAAYCASKAALQALTQSCAKTLAERSIRVNAVAPGAILWQEDATTEQKQKVLDHIPMKRTGTANDIAAAVVFLAQQDYITGQTLKVYGGWGIR